MTELPYTRRENRTTTAATASGHPAREGDKPGPAVPSTNPIDTPSRSPEDGRGDTDAA